MCENVLEKHFCRELFGQEKIIKKTVVPRCSFRGKKMWFVTSISGEIAEILPIDCPEVPSIKCQNLRLKWHQNNDINKISKTSLKETGHQMFNPPHPSSWNLLKTWRQKSTGRPVKRQWVFFKVYPFQRDYSPMTDYTQLTIPIHLTLLFLPPNGRVRMNHHWDYCSKEFNLKCLTFKRHLLLRHGAEDLQCLQKGKCKGRMLSLNS